MFSLGGAGMIILDQTHNPTTPKINRMMLQVSFSTNIKQLSFVLLQLVGFGGMMVSFVSCFIFMRMKLPGYMQS
jgi:hypothetical protein